MKKALLLNFSVALQAIAHNKLRGILTSLGIVFGVASVISMLAIGRGAEQEILEQMKLLGTNNVIVTPIVEQEEGKVENATESEQAKLRKKFTTGLTLRDAAAAWETIPHVDFVSPEIVVETTVLREGLKRSGKLVGVDSTFFRTTDFKIVRGAGFTPLHLLHSAPVCIIGYGIRTKFFAREEPIGREIKCGNLWLTVIGVLEERKITKQNIQHLGLRDYNMDIYTPVTTLLLRYKNRTLVTRQDIQQASRSTQSGNENTEDKKPKNYHQLDRMVARVSESRFVPSVSEVLTRMLQRRHNGVVDYQVTVPEELLRQEQRTKQIFSIVLGAIASISLLVGGIGIMNIMLASVLERTKEIGIRRSLGATQRDVVLQFLSEAVAISVTGGCVGVLLGAGLSLGVVRFAGILSIVTVDSVLLSFVISISIGIIFGILPAKRAAEQDPIVALRYE
ncbi:MAG: ABC transporter permease [Ignavibacteriales bacterium]|nr:ABC transporter permease [Ignavibacteriales bacterium]